MGDKIIKYKTSNFTKTIEKIEIERETKKTVWIKYIDFIGKERLSQERKITDYHRYFDSFNEAKEYLIDKYTKQVESSKERLFYAENKLLKIEAFEEIDT